MERPLDLDTVQAFVRIAELGSFTRAAEAMRTTQTAVSLKLKRLEDRLGFRLLERTPRYVQLSTRGAAFLEPARERPLSPPPGYSIPNWLTDILNPQGPGSFRLKQQTHRACDKDHRG